jgi:DNA-binding CsgD family transcriptional regulator
MKPAVYEEARKIWKLLSQSDSKDITSHDYRLELELHKKLLSFFQVGNYYYYVFNVKESAFDFMSAEVKSVLGYSLDEIDVPLMISSIHPEDQPWFLSCENKVSEFFSGLTITQIPNYKVRYDYRIRKKSGDYIRILQQVVTIQFDEQGHVLRTFGTHTDISHLKREGNPVLSFIGLNGEPSYTNVAITRGRLEKPSELSEREREVLSLVVQGHNSEKIGKLLFISKNTVETHRRNILRKTGFSSTPALISHAIKSGLV